MTKYVVFDKDGYEFVQTIYSNSISFDKHRNNALEADTVEEAKAILSLAKARCSSTRVLAIRVTETTEKEYDPDAPSIKG